MSRKVKLFSSAEFNKQARQFAKWYRLERQAALELGKIAAGWVQHYSRTRNAQRFADALYNVTGVRVTGRSILNYRNIYVLHTAWQESRRLRPCKCRNRFQIHHVDAGHLRIVAAARLPDKRKHALLDEVETRRLTKVQTVACARRYEVDHNRQKRTVKLRKGNPQVVDGDAIDVIKRLEPAAIHHLFADWQWKNTGLWRDTYRKYPVHRPVDPVEHLCRFIEEAMPYIHKNCIIWIFSKTTAFENGEIGLPHRIQKAAFGVGLQYASEYVMTHTVAGYRSKNTFLAIKHLPIHAFVREGFNFAPISFSPSISEPMTSPNHVSQSRAGTERHPYQKPVTLFENLLSMGTPGGVVFDAFAGSGAAGVAAVRKGHPYLGAELQSHYARMANCAIVAALEELSRTALSA